MCDDHERQQLEYENAIAENKGLTTKVVEAARVSKTEYDAKLIELQATIDLLALQLVGTFGQVEKIVTTLCNVVEALQTKLASKEVQLHNQAKTIMELEKRLQSMTNVGNAGGIEVEKPTSNAPHHDEEGTASMQDTEAMMAENEKKIRAAKSIFEALKALFDALRAAGEIVSGKRTEVDSEESQEPPRKKQCAASKPEEDEDDLYR